MSESQIIQFGSLNTYTTSRGIKAQESTIAKNLVLDEILGDINTIGPFSKYILPTGITSLYFYDGIYFTQCGNKLYIDLVESLILLTSDKLFYVPVINIDGDTYLLISNSGGSYKYFNGEFSNVGTASPDVAPSISNGITSVAEIHRETFTSYYEMDPANYVRGDSLDTHLILHEFNAFNGNISEVAKFELLYGYNPNGEKVKLGSFAIWNSKLVEVEDDDTNLIRLKYINEGPKTFSDGLEISNNYITDSYGVFQLPNTSSNIHFKMTINLVNGITSGAYKMVFMSKKEFPANSLYANSSITDYIIEEFPLPAVTGGVDTVLDFTIDPSATDWFGNGYEHLCYIQIVDKSFSGSTNVFNTIKDFAFYDADQYGTLNIEAAFYIYTYYNSGTLFESDASPAPLYNGIRTKNSKVGVNVIASLDPQIDQIKIYRLDSATSGDYKLVTTLPTNTTQTYWDNINSASLGVIYTGNFGQPPIPGLSGMISVADKVFGFKDNIIYNSNSNDPEAWGDGVSNKTQIGDKYDILTINSIGNNIIITKKDTQSIFVMNVIGNAPFEIKQIQVDSTPIGSSSVSTKDGVVFLAYDGIYIFNGFTVENISLPVKDKFHGNHGYLNMFNDKIYCSNPPLEINLSTKFITEYSVDQINVVANLNSQLAMGLSNGLLYIKLNSNNNEVFPFNLHYKSKDFVFDEPQEYKSIRRCYIEVYEKDIVKINILSHVAFNGLMYINIGGEDIPIDNTLQTIFYIVPENKLHNMIYIHPHNDKFYCTDLHLEISINGVLKPLYNFSGGYWGGTLLNAIDYTLTDVECSPNPVWEDDIIGSAPIGWTPVGAIASNTIGLKEDERYWYLRNGAAAQNLGAILTPDIAIALGTTYVVSVDLLLAGGDLYIGDDLEKWGIISLSNPDLTPHPNGETDRYTLDFEYTPTFQTDLGIYSNTTTPIKPRIYKLSIRPLPKDIAFKASKLAAYLSYDTTIIYPGYNPPEIPDVVFWNDPRWHALLHLDNYMDFYIGDKLNQSKRLWNGINDFSMKPNYKGKDLSFAIRSGGGGLSIKTPTLLLKK